MRNKQGPYYQPLKPREWEIVSIRVPKEKKEYYRRRFYQLYLEEEADMKYISIRDMIEKCMPLKTIANKMGMKLRVLRNYIDRVGLKGWDPDAPNRH